MGELIKDLAFGVGDPLDRFLIESGRKAIENQLPPEELR